MDLETIYSQRNTPEQTVMMTGVWRALVDGFFQKWIKPDDSVLDVGAGLCHFINMVQAGRKVAFDGNPTIGRHCNRDVEFVHGTKLSEAVLGGKFNVIFMSNFLEHLDTPDCVLEVLNDARDILNPGGRLIILQPNFALLGALYFDVLDHKVIITDSALLEALDFLGYDIVYKKRRFLPYSSRSALPKAAWLVKLYLRVPLAHFFLGKQSLIIATPKN